MKEILISFYTIRAIGEMFADRFACTGLYMKVKSTDANLYYVIQCIKCIYIKRRAKSGLHIIQIWETDFHSLLYIFFIHRAAAAVVIICNDINSRVCFSSRSNFPISTPCSHSSFFPFLIDVWIGKYSMKIRAATKHHKISLVFCTVGNNQARE